MLEIDSVDKCDKGGSWIYIGGIRLVESINARNSFLGPSPLKFMVALICTLFISISTLPSNDMTSFLLHIYQVFNSSGLLPFFRFIQGMTVRIMEHIYKSNFNNLVKRVLI